MVSKLFVVSMARLCTKKSPGEDTDSWNGKPDELTTTGIGAPKDNTLKKCLKIIRGIFRRLVRHVQTS